MKTKTNQLFKKYVAIKNEVLKLIPNNCFAVYCKDGYQCIVVKHNDDRGWAYFIDSGYYETIDRYNRKLSSGYFTVESQSFAITRVKNFRVFCDNIEASRAYNGILTRMFGDPDYIEYRPPFGAFMCVSPTLFANAYDALFNAPRHKIYSNACSKRQMTRDFMQFMSNEFFGKKGNTLKEVSGINVKYVRVAYEVGCSIDRIKEVYQHYSPEELYMYKSILLKYGRLSDNPIILNNREVVKYASSLYGSKNEYYNTQYDDYRDYLNMLIKLKTDGILCSFPLIPTTHTVKYLHDKIIDFYNKNQDAIRAQKEQALLQRYKENVYDLAKAFDYAGSEYSIFAAKELSDLYEEGRVLSHCVGSYTSSVSSGLEYILFLRKNDSLNTPLYTIDITPNKKVRQIHGKYNCNLPNALMPFVKEWAKKFSLDLTGCNGVKCALSSYA